ncbi:MAG: hypothetical protein J0H67_08470 [Rhodospirillales bacterium]|nr:hypothetical protein [Rhodospirillales bacterium]
MTEYRTPEDVAQEFGISRLKLIRFCRKHGVPLLDLNGSIRFDQVAIQALEEACRSRSSPAPTRALSGSSAPSSQRGPRRADAFANALALTTPNSRQTKRSAK